MCISVSLFLTEQRRQNADSAFLPKEIITHYITENNSPLSLCLSRLYIFTVSIPSLHPLPLSLPMFLLP